MQQARSFIHTPSIKSTTIYSRAVSSAGTATATITPFRTASISSRHNNVAKIWNSRKTDLTVRHTSAGFVQQHLRNITMASATSVYEFEPLNSAFSSVLPPSTSLLHPPPSSSPSLSLSLSKPQANPLPHSRKGRTSPPIRLPRQSHPHRQHSLQMRFHTTIRRPRKTLQISQGEARGWFCDLGVPLQSVRWAGTWVWWGYSAVLSVELWGFVSDCMLFSLLLSLELLFILMEQEFKLSVFSPLTFLSLY
jgi:hypothetical protein